MDTGLQGRGAQALTSLTQLRSLGVSRWVGTAGLLHWLLDSAGHFEL
jgi:hypothetical protein